MKRAVLLTGHFADQKRRASLHWVAEALQAEGWHVTIVTVGFSWLSVLRGDRRLAGRSLPTSRLRHLSPTLSTLSGLAPVHPFSTRNRALDAGLRPLQALFCAYWAPRLRRVLPRSRLVVVESGPPVMLAPWCRRLAPGARLVYRVNDDMALLGLPEFLLRMETGHAALFDRISTASPVLAARFPRQARVHIDPMGVPRAELASPGADPFVPRARVEAVCAGTTQLDVAALLRIAEARPHWRLHVLGRTRTRPPRRANLVFHGETCFGETVRHVAHADIGLAPYRDLPGIEYQTTNSNRLLLYRHFGLPVLGPDRLCSPSVPSVVGYSEPGALERCERMRRRPENIPDWSELARRIAGQKGDTDPPAEVATVPAMA